MTLFVAQTSRTLLIQPPGEPREQHLGDDRPKKFHKRQNDSKGRYNIDTFLKANFILLLSSKISQSESLKLLEVLVFLFFLFQSSKS